MHVLSGTIQGNPEQKDFGDSSLVAYDKNVTSIEPVAKFKYKRTKQAWNMTIQGLLAMRILGPLDVHYLEQGFIALDQMYKMQKMLDDYDKSVEEPLSFNKDALDARAKIVRMMQMNFATYSQVMSKFGIGPSDRAKLTIQHEEKSEDPLDVVLGE